MLVYSRKEIIAKFGDHRCFGRLPIWSLSWWIVVFVVIEETKEEKWAFSHSGRKYIFFCYFYIYIHVWIFL